MKKETVLKNVFKSIHHFFVLFLLVAFVATCCTMLFVSTMQSSMNTVFTDENIKDAAKLTMLNVIVLSVIFTAIDIVRRKITVDSHVRKISDAAHRITKGDFSIRIKPCGDERFDEIIKQINKMAQELGGVETLRSDFISNVSHEMKTPLAVMHNYGTLLSAPELSEEKRLEYAKAVTDSSRKLSDMMSNILKLNRLENQQIKPSFEYYDLSEQICECLLAFENIWEEKELLLECDIEDGVEVFCERELMSIVWNNLFSNAIKFTDRGGRVGVSVKKEGGRAIVRVSDSGCGISSEVGAHIFDKFYQADRSRTTEGNGLGLCLVRRIVDIVGCDIAVESEVGVGSIFTVVIKG